MVSEKRMERKVDLIYLFFGYKSINLQTGFTKVCSDMIVRFARPKGIDTEQDFY